MEGKDANGLKIEEDGQTLSQQKIPKTIKKQLWVALFKTYH